MAGTVSAEEFAKLPSATQRFLLDHGFTQNQDGSVTGHDSYVPVVSELHDALDSGVDAAGKVVNKVGQATGLAGPTDLVDEQALYGPTQTQAADLYKSATERAAAGPLPPQEIRQPGTVTAPTITAQTIGRELVGAPTEGTAATRGTAQTAGTAPTRGTAPTTATAATAAPVQAYQAATVGAPRDVQFRGVETGVRAPVIGPAAQAGPVDVKMATVGPASRVAPTQVQRTDISRDEANAARGDLAGAARDIRNAPSAAAHLYDAALGKVAREQLGAAAQARGSERAGLKREAIINIGERGMTAAAEKAGLSAQEEQAKRMGYASTLSGVRGQDIGLATDSANLRQGANLAQANITAGEQSQNSRQAQEVNLESARLAQQAYNLQADIDKALALGNMEAVNQLKAQQAQLQLAARQTEVGAGVQMAGLRTSVDVGNADRSLAAATGDANRVTDAAAAYAAASNVAGQNAAARETAVNVGNIDRGVLVDEAAVSRYIAQQEASLGRALTQDEAAVARRAAQEQANLDRGVTVATTNAANTMDANKYNATATNTANTTNATNSINTQTTNVGNQLTRDTNQGNLNLQTQQLNQQGAATAYDDALAASRLGMDAASGIAGAQTAQGEREDASSERLVKTVTAPLPYVLPKPKTT